MMYRINIELLIEADSPEEAANKASELLQETQPMRIDYSSGVHIDPLNLEETPWALPKPVYDLWKICDAETYADAERWKQEIEKHGYTCSIGVDAVIYGIRKNYQKNL